MKNTRFENKNDNFLRREKIEQENSIEKIIAEKRRADIDK